jgi:hypothetical protein
MAASPVASRLYRLLGAALLFATSAAQAQVERNPDGEWGAPQSNVTVGGGSSYDNGLYLIDIQASYPDVNWTAVDRIYIQAGQYKFIRIGNLPDRSVTPDRPLIITNIDGQVRVGGMEHYYLFSISGGKNWILTGKYDPISLSGDKNYPAHRGNNYASNQGTYGIVVDDDFYKFGTGNSGIGVGSSVPNGKPNPPTSDFEISFVEVTRVGFAGMAIKTDDNDTVPMDNVYLHDIYIHDIGSEGIYLGSTQNQNPQHSFNNLRIENNRILRTGTEGLQVGQLGDGCEINNNVVVLSAIDWKDAFQAYQDNSGQIAFRYGHASVHHNIFIGAADALISFQAINAAGDVHSPGDTLTIHNNFFSSTRFLDIFMGQNDQPRTAEPTSDGVTVYKIVNNTFRHSDFQKEEIYGAWPLPNEEVVRVNQRLTNQIELSDNILDTPGLDHLYLSKFPYCTKLILNGQSCNINAWDNRRESVDPVTFHNFLPGLPANVDYLLVERWSNTSYLKQGEPITYTIGDYVMHRGEVYLANENNTSIEPGDSTSAAGTWTLMPSPVDDVRLGCASAHQGVGLLDVLPAFMCAPSDNITLCEVEKGVSHDPVTNENTVIHLFNLHENESCMYKVVVCSTLFETHYDPDTGVSYFDEIIAANALVNMDTSRNVFINVVQDTALELRLSNNTACKDATENGKASTKGNGKASKKGKGKAKKEGKKDNIFCNRPQTTHLKVRGV